MQKGCKVRIVITGGGGYIGSMMAKEFSRFAHVVVFDSLMYNQGPLLSQLFTNDDSKRIKFYNEDVTKWSENLSRELWDADVIIPLAALVGAPLCEAQPELSEAINHEWYQQLLAHLHGQLVIYPNTNSGYGSTGDAICTEETPSNPISLYGKQKQRTENLLLNEYGDIICFRLATVFGMSYRPRFDLLVNDLTRTAYEDEEIEVFDGHFRRNYIHVKDIVRAFEFAIQNKKKMYGQTFNLGNDNINSTKMKLAQDICDIVGGDVIEMENKTDPDKRDYEVSSKKLYDLGFSPIYSLEAGVKEVLHYYSFLHNDAVNDMCRNY